MAPSRMERGYRMARYVAGPMVIRIDKPSASVDAWLAGHRAAAAVLLSAWNPMSKRRPAARNARAHGCLLHAVRQRPHAEGISGTADWQELMVAVVGDARLGRRLARRFRQRAFVLLRRGRPAALVYSPWRS